MTDQNKLPSNVLKFRALVDSDPALQHDISQHIGVGEGGWDAAAIVEIGRVKGLHFSANDLMEVMEEDDELTDFELEMVAAAGSTSCIDGGV